MTESETQDNETTLSLSLSKSINEEALSSLSGIAEVGLDSIIEEGFLKDVPILSTVTSIYRIGKSVRERHHLKNSQCFLMSSIQSVILLNIRAGTNSTLAQEIETKRLNT